jgi:peptide/nickel transport system substrate-binding protein
MLQAFAATTAAGLAGCNTSQDGDGSGDGGDGGGGSGGGELGERVPPVVFEYWSNMGRYTTIFEAATPTVKENLEEALGVTVELKPQEYTTLTSNILNDQRENHFAWQLHYNNPDRFDPDEMTRRWAIDWAGGNGKANLMNYASCEFSEPAISQQTATDTETRQELVNDAHTTFSDDIATIPVAPTLMLGAARSGKVEVDRVGDMGVNFNNPYVYVNSEPLDGDRILTNTNPAAIATNNFPVINTQVSIWSRLVHSPLVEYDENIELRKVLAETLEIENDATEFTVELRDATFHNGDPVTAEDVQFTFDHLASHPGAFPRATDVPYESIDVIDERTVQFTTERPFLPLRTKVFAKWGILHKESWVEGGAPEDPEGFTPDEVIGSGPFQVDTFRVKEVLDLSPHEGNPVHQPDHGVTFQAYQDTQSAFQAFQSGELHLWANISPQSIDNVEQKMSDDATTYQSIGNFPYYLAPYYPRSPTKFRPFRDAVGKALNRKKIISLAFYDLADPILDSTVLLPTHPSAPEKENLYTFTDNPAGDPEAARSVLEEAGWGWDGNGNLHYPAGADLSPMWPKGERPSPDDFPCVDESGEFVGGDS